MNTLLFLLYLDYVAGFDVLIIWDAATIYTRCQKG